MLISVQCRKEFTKFITSESLIRQRIFRDSLIRKFRTGLSIGKKSWQKTLRLTNHPPPFPSSQCCDWIGNQNSNPHFFCNHLKQHCPRGKGFRSPARKYEDIAREFLFVQMSQLLFAKVMGQRIYHWRHKALLSASLMLPLSYLLKLVPTPPAQRCILEMIIFMKFQLNTLMFQFIQLIQLNHLKFEHELSKDVYNIQLGTEVS